MSIVLELHGSGQRTWPLSTVCVRQIERLRQRGSTEEVAALLGDEMTDAGTPRSLSRLDLLESVRKLRADAAAIPAGFQMIIPPLFEGMKPTVGGGGVSGLLIGDTYYKIKCREDHWIIQSIDDSRLGKEPTPRFDAAEVATDNMGVIKIVPRKRGQSELSTLLREIERFLEADSNDAVRIIWG